MSRRSSRDITCGAYKAVAGSRRCRHYGAGGACGLPDADACVEWRKVNPNHPPPAQESPFGLARAREKAPRKKPRAPATTKQEAASTGACAVAPKSSVDVASFKALGVEICMTSPDLGDIWLVPEYTSLVRREISCDDAVTLATVCAEFPGARVSSFRELERERRC